MAPLVVDQEQQRKHPLRVGSWSHPHDTSRKLRVTLSAAFAEDHLDTESGVRVGPTLLHVALTNRPYVRRLQSFTPVHLSDGTVIVELIEEVLVPTTASAEGKTEVELDPAVLEDRQRSIPLLGPPAGSFDRGFRPRTRRWRPRRHQRATCTGHRA